MAARWASAQSGSNSPPPPKKKNRNRGFLQRCEEKLVSGGLSERWRALGWASPAARDRGSSAGPERPSRGRTREALEQSPGASFKQATVLRVTRKPKILGQNSLSEALFDYFTLFFFLLAGWQRKMSALTGFPHHLGT